MTSGSIPEVLELNACVGLPRYQFTWNPYKQLMLWKSQVVNLRKELNSRTCRFLRVKVIFQLVNKGRGVHFPLETNGPDISVVWLSTPPPQRACYLPSITRIHLSSRGVIMVKCLTQGHTMLIVTGLEPTTFCL